MSVKPPVFLLLSLTSKECLCECQATGVSAVEHGRQWILLQVCLCWYLVSRELCMTEYLQIEIGDHTNPCHACCRCVCAWPSVVNRI